MTGSAALPPIDRDWMLELLLDLLAIPSPTGRTAAIMAHLHGVVADACGAEPTVGPRGTVRVPLEEGPRARAVAVHADTIGCMVSGVTDRGRLEVVSVGAHPARSAEGARVRVLGDDAHDVTPLAVGTIVPLEASGHAAGDGVDAQGAGWDHVEIRLDAMVGCEADVAALGIRVGDFVALDPSPTVTGPWIAARHLDDKAGIAAVLAAVRAIRSAGLRPQRPAHLLITVAEEADHGATDGFLDSIEELVAVDLAVVAPGQRSREQAVTVAGADRSGPFDFGLTRRLLALAEQHGIDHERDVFRRYRSDAAAAVESGAALRTAVVGFGVDASHGHERTHLDGLVATAQLVAAYLLSG